MLTITETQGDDGSHSAANLRLAVRWPHGGWEGSEPAMQLWDLLPGSESQ